MSFPVDSVGGNLRQPPLPKTKRIIAFLPPKSNRKAKLLPTTGNESAISPSKKSQDRDFVAADCALVVFAAAAARLDGDHIHSGRQIEVERELHPCGVGIAA